MRGTSVEYESRHKGGKGRHHKGGKAHERKHSPFLDFCRRFLKNKTAFVGLLILFVLILSCAAAPLLTPYDPNKIDAYTMFCKPCFAHPFGCDSYGRDLLARMLYGGRNSLSVGIIVALIGAAFGTIVGGLIGYIGGEVDMVAMRIVDMISSIPGNLLTIVLATIMAKGPISLVIALSVGGLSGSVRGPRAMALRERSYEYIEASQSVNASKLHILFKHIIPNTIAPTIIGTTMGIGGTITSVASLAYIGLGVQPPTPEWGTIISEGRTYMLDYPHLILIPGLVITVTVLAFNLFGDGLRDALDPKLKN